MAKRPTAANPLDTPEGRALALEAIADAGLPLNERAANALIDKFADIVEGRTTEASIDEQRREHFFNPDGDGEP